MDILIALSNNGKQANFVVLLLMAPSSCVDVCVVIDGGGAEVVVVGLWCGVWCSGVVVLLWLLCGDGDGRCRILIFFFLSSH